MIAGASRGIGAVTARAFAEAGAAVVLAARDAQALEAVASSIRSAGGQALAVPTDVGDDASVEHLVQSALAAFGRLDAAFNNATDSPRLAPLAEIDPGEFDRGIRTNLRGTFLGKKHQIPAMLRSGGGAIVNMASVAGFRGFSQLAVYVAAKAGIVVRPGSFSRRSPSSRGLTLLPVVRFPAFAWLITAGAFLPAVVASPPLARATWLPDRRCGWAPRGGRAMTLPFRGCFLLKNATASPKGGANGAQEVRDG